MPRPAYRLSPSTNPPVRGPSFLNWHIAWLLHSHAPLRYASHLIKLCDYTPPQKPTLGSAYGLSGRVRAADKPSDEPLRKGETR